MSESQRIERVLVAGAGWVGRQIAACVAQADITVWIEDVSPEVAADAMQWMSSAAAKPSSAGLFDMQASPGGSPTNQITPVRNAEANAEGPVADTESADDPTPIWQSKVRIWNNSLEPAQVDLVIECVPEQASVKKRALRKLSDRFPPPTIIASNSSYFVPSLLAPFLQHPERFANCHFHVPVLRPSVVDIVGHGTTDPAVIDRLRAFVAKTRHQPIVLDTEHPGYIFNWLLQSVLKSAMELRAKEVASVEDIDRAWKAVTGMPLGPFGIMDQIGLDLIEQTLRNAKWARHEQVDIDSLLGVLKPLIEAGQLGKKTGGGFFNYNEPQS